MCLCDEYIVCGGLHNCVCQIKSIQYGQFKKNIEELYLNYLTNHYYNYFNSTLIDSNYIAISELYNFSLLFRRSYMLRMLLILPLTFFDC